MSVNNLPTYNDNLRELRISLKEMLPKESLDVFDNDAVQLNESLNKILKVKEGDQAPDFTLANAIGKSIKLYDILNSNKVVLVFYRGTWCPYCNLALSHYQSSLQEIKKLGAELIAISPQTPNESLSIKEKNSLEFEVLSDNGNFVAQLYTKVFKNGSAPLNEMQKLGYDFDSFYGNDSKEIPVPAVFIIEQSGLISFGQSAGGDYRNRTDINSVIRSLKNRVESE